VNSYKIITALLHGHGIAVIPPISRRIQIPLMENQALVMQPQTHGVERIGVLEISLSIEIRVIQLTPALFPLISYRVSAHGICLPLQEAMWFGLVVDWLCSKLGLPIQIGPRLPMMFILHKLGYL